jgi:hypothetical protein
VASYLTSSKLIESIKRRETIPTSQVTFEEDDFLAFANEEIQMGLVPTVLQFHQDYLVYEETIPLVANQSEYPVPYRAIGQKIRHIFYSNNGTIQELGRINPEDSIYYNYAQDNVHGFFFFRNNMIVLCPSVGASPTGSLIVNYFRRPNQLVSEDRLATISAIDANTGVVTVDAVPSGMSTASLIDFIEVKGGHRCKAIDVLPTASSGTTLTFALADLPSDLAVGDHVNFAGECCIPQIPDDLHPMLAQRVAARCLEALKDTEGLTQANTKLVEMEIKSGTLIDNRSEGNPQKVVNLRGPLRGRHRRRF